MNNKFFKKSAMTCAALTLSAMLVGCGGSRDNFVITNTNAIGAPVAANDAIAALGNATLNQTAANGVLVNDTLNGAAISGFDAVGSQGGTIALNPDGSFTYSPVAGFVGAETFTYTLTNNTGSSTATVTLTSTGLGRFVDNSAAVNGTGTQASPFDNLADGLAAAQNGDTIFVARGDGTNNNLAGAIALPAGVDLVGEGTGLILTQTIVPQGQAPVLTGPVTCGGDNTIQGILFDGGGVTDDGVFADMVGNVTVSNNTFRNYTSNYVDLNDLTGTNTVDSNTFDPGDNGDNLDFDNVDTDCTLIITDNTFTDDNTTDPSSDAVELDIEGTSVIALTFTGNNITGSGTTNSFSEGLEIDTDQTSALTFTIDNNTFSGFEENAIDLDSDDTSTASGSVSGNTASDTSSNGIELESSGGTTTVTGNTISNAGTNGLDLDFETDGTFVVTNNQITGSATDAIDYFDTTAGPALVAIRNNTLTGSGGLSIEVGVDGTSVCCDISGNTVDDDMGFDDQGGGTLSVEQFSLLDTINTVQIGFMANEPGDAVVDVADGFCAIP